MRQEANENTADPEWLDGVDLPDGEQVLYDAQEHSLDQESESYRPHSFAEIFPLGAVAGPEWEEFKVSVGEKQLESITLFEGKILDGRRRHRALAELGKDSATKQFVGSRSEALDYSKTVNLHRRHLGKGQRAMVGVEYKKQQEAIGLEAKREAVRTFGRGHPKDAGRFAVNLPQAASQAENGDPPSEEAKTPPRAPDSRTVAANAVGVSPRLIDAAEKVKTHGVPELVAMVNADEVAISAAAKVAALPVDEQKAAVAGGPEGVRAAASEARKPKAVRPKVDDLGFPIQPHAEGAFAEIPKFNALIAKLKECEKDFGELCGGAARAHIAVGSQWVVTGKDEDGVEKGKHTLSYISNAIAVVKAAKPSVTDCPYAHNAHMPHGDDCTLCRNARWCGALKTAQVPPAMMGRMKAHYAEISEGQK